MGCACSAGHEHGASTALHIFPPVRQWMQDFRLELCKPNDLRLFAPTKQ